MPLELANHAYLAASIFDRGDPFFEHLTEPHNALLADQEAGPGNFSVLVDAGASLLGRFNLYRLTNATAELGYRVAVGRYGPRVVRA